MKKTRLIATFVLGIGTAMGATVGCGGEEESLGTAEEELRYSTGLLKCTLRADEEDMDTPPVKLEELTIWWRIRWSEDSALLEHDPALKAAVPPTMVDPRLFRMFRSTGAVLEAAPTAPPLGFALADLLVAQNTRFAWFTPLAPGQTRNFIVAQADLPTWDPLSLFTDQLRSGVLEATPSLNGEALIATQRAGQQRESPTLTLDQAETIALLKHLGSTKLTSPELPALGSLYCDDRQVHLPPEKDNGLSFHVRFCCDGWGE
jgi:hypothetical protein